MTPSMREKLDFKVNVQNLLSTVVIAGGLIAWANNMASRVASLEEWKRTQEAVEKRQDEQNLRREDQILQAIAELRADLKRNLEKRR